jgi:methionyl-tRNA synthetase
MNVFIGGAWPYANGSLHLGHISSLLPGDIIARYYRLKGDNVLYVSGSDCNGTPIAIRARQEGKLVTEITDNYHKEFVDCFKKLRFSYDYYSRTDSEDHHIVVQEIFLKLLSKKLIYKKHIDQSFCEECDQFLPDRYVIGKCPTCGADARGDQCDSCSTILEPLDLTNRSCKICGETPSVRKTEHFFLNLKYFQYQLEDYLGIQEETGSWRENAISLTKRYLNEGLQDRAVSRDLPIGVSVPVKGFEEKKIYVWIEAVAGYLSASKQWANEKGTDWAAFWTEESTNYYVHGKDNIPFHTIIWPALLLGLGGHSLPSHIISNEYLTLERKKFSTSNNYAIWLPDLLARFNPDSIRYYVTINAPEKRDSDFSWREFVYSHNGELLGAYGNFVNRTLKFIEKAFQREIPKGKMNQKIKEDITFLYTNTGIHIEKGELKTALESIFEFIRKANKYFDDHKPWLTVTEDPENCADTLFTCVQIIGNLSNLLDPFLPNSTEKIREFLEVEKHAWTYIEVKNKILNKPSVLFERIDPAIIEEERQKLNL